MTEVNAEEIQSNPEIDEEERQTTIENELNPSPRTDSMFQDIDISEMVKIRNLLSSPVSLMTKQYTNFRPMIPY